MVNFDGTLAWIAGAELRTKATGAGARTLGSSDAIDRRFLGLENDRGCAVTWRVGGASQGQPYGHRGEVSGPQLGSLLAKTDQVPVPLEEVGVARVA